MAKSNNTKLVAGALVGAAAGAAAGVLFAPKSGKETREMIKDKANKMSDDAKDAVETGKGKLIHATNKAKGKAHETRAAIADKAEEVEAKSRAKL